MVFQRLHSAHRRFFFLTMVKMVDELIDLDPWDSTRRDMLILLLRTIIEKNIKGDFAELGVYQGKTAKLIHHYAPERNLHLFDTFEGFGQKMAMSESSHTDIKNFLKTFC